MSDLTLFDLETEAWQPIVNQWGKQICRDCGRSKFTWKHGCGGADSTGLWNLCDDCSALDGRGTRSDGVSDCSRWGTRTTDREYTRLVALQKDRRAAWRKSHSSSTTNTKQKED